MAYGENTQLWPLKFMSRRLSYLRSALDSLWHYNYTAFSDPKMRLYAYKRMFPGMSLLEIQPPGYLIAPNQNFINRVISYTSLLN